MAMYFAASNLDVAVSRDKRKLRRFAKRNLRFAGTDLRLGVINFQTFQTPTGYQAEFGASLLYDLDQRLVFRPDFSVVRSF